MAKRRKMNKRGRLIEQVITSRDRVVFDGRRPRPDPFAPRRFEPLEPPTAPEAMARRHERASFIPTPVTHMAPTRPFYHRGSRPLFEQPSPTELQDYGSSEDVHTREGQDAIGQANEFAVKSANLADEGDCNTSRRFLNAAHGYVGHAVAHSKSGGRVDGITMVASTVDRAEAHYTKRCKVTRRRK